MLKPNTIIYRRYRVTQLIGVGGTGAVYQAYDQQRGQIVALKHLLLNHPQAVRSFEREARLLASLRHPALPRVLDSFSAAEGQFLAMEFVAGDDLSALLQQSGRGFPVDQVLGWADQLLQVLAYLHDQQSPVIHRDIKPQNLKLRPGAHQELVLLDFGLAKGHVSQLGSTTLSTTSSAFGYTLHYAPLEQIQGLGTDPRSDLYALSATLYHLLAGAPPVDALTRAAAVINGGQEPLVALHSVNPQVPVAMSDLLHQGLALKLGDRPANAETMRQQLLSARQQSLLAYTGNTVIVGGPAYPPVHRLRRSSVMRRPIARVLLPICVVLAVAVGILALKPLATFANQVISATVSEPPVSPPNVAPVIAFDTSLVKEVVPLPEAALNIAHVQAVAFSQDGRVFAAGSADGTIRVGSLQSERGAATRTLEGISEPIHCLAFSPDGATLAVGTRDGRVSLWHVADGALLYTFKKHFQGVSAVAFSPDGQRLATASTDDTIRVWRLSDHMLQLDQEGHYERDTALTKDARSLTFSPDGQALLTGFANGVIELRSLRDGSVLRTFEGHTSYVYSLAFAPDGQTFASGANDLRVWRVRNGQLIHRIDAHTGGVTSVAFSHDGRLLASGSYDTTAKLWSARDGALQYSLVYNDPVRMVAFGPDGRSLSAGGGDQMIAVWRLAPALR